MKVPRSRVGDQSVFTLAGLDVFLTSSHTSDLDSLSLRKMFGRREFFRWDRADILESRSVYDKTSTLHKYSFNSIDKFAASKTYRLSSTSSAKEYVRKSFTWKATSQSELR